MSDSRKPVSRQNVEEDILGNNLESVVKGQFMTWRDRVVCRSYLLAESGDSDDLEGNLRERVSGETEWGERPTGIVRLRHWSTTITSLHFQLPSKRSCMMAAVSSQTSLLFC